jgi:hypothetical protein
MKPKASRSAAHLSGVPHIYMDNRNIKLKLMKIDGYAFVVIFRFHVS